MALKEHLFHLENIRSQGMRMKRKKLKSDVIYPLYSIPYSTLQLANIGESYILKIKNLVIGGFYIDDLAATCH